MKSLLSIISCIVLALSCIWAQRKIGDIKRRDTELKNWKRTTATIDYIEEPGGHVYGTYTCDNNEVREKQLIYTDRDLDKKDAKKADALIGTQIEILYNPDSMMQDIYDPIKPNDFVFVIPFAASLTYLIWSGNRKNKQKNEEY